jgi:hypothetical protein
MTVQSTPAGRTPAAQRQQAQCRELCRAHGAALIAVAQLVLDDARDVCEVVAEAVAAECRGHLAIDGSGIDVRQRLARSVYDRSRGRLVTRERFGERRAGPALPEPPSMLGRMSAEVRAAVALTVFGRHGLNEAAAVLSVSPETVQRHLRAALSYARFLREEGTSTASSIPA